MIGGTVEAQYKCQIIFMQKVNIDFVNNCEYGCDNPCEKAKDFWKELSNKLDDLLDKLQQLLRKEDERK